MPNAPCENLETTEETPKLEGSIEKKQNSKQSVRQLKRLRSLILDVIELVCLKNRYGVSSYSCRFKYYTRYDYFLSVRNEEA